MTVLHRYVNRDANPADDRYKGLKLGTFIKNDRWLIGPEFLWEDEARWPKMIDIPCVKDVDPEIRKESQVNTASVSRDVMGEVIKYYSTWWKLKLTISWLLCYKQYLRNKTLQRTGGSQSNDELVERRGCLVVEELQEAEEEILRYIQEKEFPEAPILQAALTTGACERSVKRLMKKAGASVSKLNPRIENWLLRAGGRIGRAPLPYEMKHPVILPYKLHVTDLIIRDHHPRMGHLGQESVLSSLRKKYWILKGRSAVRRVLNKCSDCHSRKAKPAEQFIAEVPKERMTPGDPPFTYVGVDCFGPLKVKQGRSHVKSYGCLFICLTMRTLHIEIVHSLSADSTINAIRRFITVRGCPKEIRSDNGTSLERADKELRNAVEQWDHHKISNFCVQREIKWKFNPPAASHMGGIWQRMVQTTKRVLKSLLKEQIVTDEVLATVMAEAVNIVNSRPLTPNSDSDLDDQPLTPNHLLHLRPTPSLPPGLFVKEDLHCRRVWRQAQYLSGVFWWRWSNE